MTDFDAPIFDKKRLQVDEFSDGDDPETAKEQALSRFFNEVKKLDPYFETVSEAIKRLKTSSDHIIKGFMEDNTAEKTSVDARTEGSAALNAISQKLKALNTQIQEEKDKEDAEAKSHNKETGMYSPELCQKIDVLHQKTKMFHSYSSNFQNSQADTKAAHEQKLKRIIRSVRHDLQDAELDFVIASGDPQALQRLIQAQSDDTYQILSDCMERNRAVQEIQKTAQEIHQLTMDAAMMCEQQSRLIEQIETNVLHAREAVQDGTTYLKKAENTLKKSNKCLCCTIIFSILGLAILILITSGIIRAVKK
ncbi:Qa-SNARE 3 [Giardia duodenalis]|uniref:Qa-SNARE 3 n=2 Tax=Giardia intestinalis TaxID=5741 RepID=E2RTW9_GIAIC|nr:Qa-SNARE 3 [Giardia intestinalis]AAM12660.1 syntaxin PM [Giardia intestinalis]KAE8302974.1 Qa-SNARE 3 [Giardia intestinalis]|eukprot:XP_001709967.1 Syntaxin 1A [Giardia lamblia ATCC 50803]